MRFQLLALIVGVCCWSWANDIVRAESPLTMLLPFNRVEADAKKTYAITEQHGPWLIYAASFRGEDAEKQAQALILELRQRFKLKAYQHRQKYDFSKPVAGLGLNRYGGAKTMRHNMDANFEDIGVLVGNFNSIDDPNLERALQQIKSAKPACLDIQKNKQSTQQYVGIRNLYRLVSSDSEKKNRGPMGNAFATRNPLLPEEYFSARSVDPLVVEMNKDAEFSLLKNNSKYTVKIATFGGYSTMKLDEIEKLAKSSGRTKLEESAIQAHQLAAALRRDGIEAYEFHDRHESLVTVGSFESVGRPLPNGTTEFSPTICSILEKFGAERKKLPGQAVEGLVPKKFGGVQCDVQPIPIEVPRVSIGASYNRNRILD